MPIEGSAGTLDIENATLRSNAIAVLTNLVTGNDRVRESSAPALEVYGDPGPRLELVSNTAAIDGTATFTRLESNVGVFSIQSGTDAATNGPITFGGFANERMRITADGNVGIGKTNPSDRLHVYGSPMIQHDTTYDFANNQGWYKIGVWDPTSNTGARLKIKFLGMEGYSSQGIARGGETILYASCNNNNPATKANIDGRLHAYGTPAITQVKFIHLDGSRHKFEIRAYIKTFVQMSMTVECTQTESFTKDVTASTDPGVGSATVSHAIFTHVINNDGNVGIGTTNPGAKLDILASASNPSTPTVHIGDNATDHGGGYGMVNLSRHPTDGGTKAHLAFIRNGNTVFSQGYYNNTNTFGFWPSFGSVANTPAMSITSTGNVGIGTTDPVGPLDVFGGSASSDSLMYVRNTANSNTDRGAGIVFENRADNGTRFSLGHILALRENSVGSYNSYLRFSPTVNGTPFEAMRIDASGNVGIGTNNPVAKLIVNAYGGPSSTDCLIIGTNTTSQNLRIGVDSTNEFCWIQSHSGKPLRLNPDGNQVQYGTSDTVLSDDRIKVNEVYIENATDTLLKLKPQIYDKKLIWNISKLGETSNTSIVREGGLITQDVWYDTPELRHLVHLGEGAEPGDDKPYTDNDPTNDPDYSSWGDNVSLLDYNGLIPYLIKSNQELHARIQALENAS